MIIKSCKYRKILSNTFFVLLFSTILFGLFYLSLREDMKIEDIKNNKFLKGYYLANTMQDDMSINKNNYNNIEYIKTLKSENDTYLVYKFKDKDEVITNLKFMGFRKDYVVENLK